MRDSGVIDPADRLTPYLPEDSRGELSEMAVDLLRRADALGAMLRPELRESLVASLRPMNGYYSNLIEGHNTHPLDVERALRRDYSRDPAKRALQLEGAAHVEVQELVDARLKASPPPDPTSAEFLRWVHGEFYARMPPEFRLLTTERARVEVVPGALRTRHVGIQEHVAPDPHELSAFLARFQREYAPDQVKPATRQVVAAAASHHRLAWIHPFLDGNGRVCRLFTDAYLARIGVGGHGLWTMSRGLGRNREAYCRALANADAPRQGDVDGRGQRSERALGAFCRFFIETAIDQVVFMSSLLEIGGLEERIAGYADRLAARGQAHPKAKLVLVEVLARGEVERGDAGRSTGLGERAGRAVVSALVSKGLLTSETPKGSLRLAFPAEAAPYYFPKLYPAEIELAAEDLTMRDRSRHRGPGR